MQRRTENFNNVQSQSNQTFNSITDTEKFDSIDEIMKNRSLNFKTIRNNRNSSSISLISLIQKNQQKRQSKKKTSMQLIRAIEKNEKMFDFNNWIRKTNLNIELKQLLTMISRTKTQLTKIIRLQSNFNRKKTKRLFTTKSKKSVQFVEQMKKINHVHELTKDNVFNNFRSNSLRRHTMKFKNLYKRMKRLAKISRNDFKISYRRFTNFVSSVSFANSLMKNFFIQTIIKSRKSLFNTWNIKKVLVNSDSTLNLISQRILETMKEITYSKKSMIMIIANENKTRLFEYTRLKIVIAKINRIIQIWIVSKDIIYSMILNRSWLRNVTTIDFYEFDEYWIKNIIVENYKKMKMFDSKKNERKKIYEIEIDVSLTQNVDEKTFSDLKYEKKKSWKDSSTNNKKNEEKNVKWKNQSNDEDKNEKYKKEKSFALSTILRRRMNQKNHSKKIKKIERNDVDAKMKSDEIWSKNKKSKKNWSKQC